MAKKQAGSPGDIAVIELQKRSMWDPKSKHCTICDGTPESHVDPATHRYRGCGAAKRLALDGSPWNQQQEYRLVIEDFPKRALRSEQERIAYSIVKALAKAGKVLTSASLSSANPTWSARDSYRLLRALEFRMILARVGESQDEIAGEVPISPVTGEEVAPTT